MHSGPNGYLGVTPVEDGWCNVCGLFKVDRSLQAEHEQLLVAYLRKNGNHELADTLAESEWRDWLRSRGLDETWQPESCRSFLAQLGERDDNLGRDERRSDPLQTHG